MRIKLTLLAMLAASAALGQDAYRKPPKAVLDVLHAPATPIVSISPTRDALLLVRVRRYPAIAELARPMLRLAGMRIDPATNGPHLPPRVVGLTLKRIDDGTETDVAVPPGAHLGMPSWSPDGRHFATTNTRADGIELWVGETETGRLRRLEGVRINAAYGPPLDWMPDNRTLLVRLVPSDRGKPPAPPAVPGGPKVQESSGKIAPVRTYQDLLQNPHDQELFDHYAASQLALVAVGAGQVTPLGAPAIFRGADPAPDGKHLLVERVRRPYSYLHPASAFPREIEVWDASGRVVHKLASLPLADQIPIEGVPTGPRGVHWRPTDPATLVWTEALDGGDPRRRVPHRDRVLASRAPFEGAPLELARTEHRFAGLTWGERDGLALLDDYDRDRRWGRTFAIDADRPAEPARVIWDLSVQDRYRDPGRPLMRLRPTGHSAILQQGDWIFLSGQGASPEGDRPFLDRFNLKTLKSERLFRSGAASYEMVVAVLKDDASTVVTRHESPTDPPNYHVRNLSDPKAGRALTRFADPAPSLRRIKKQLVTYSRADGVQLSFTLYLPPDYKEGTRLPTVVWAYPFEFNDPGTAGQVAGSTQRFTSIPGASHLFFLLEGYAILDDARMPVVGDPETVNNTYVEQIVSSARAAVEKAAQMGVTDPRRVGVGGHSYGAFMTANLLAHSDLFRAGIARSGAYNRTLTPFGFQRERRTIWEAPELYARMSPFMYADKIKEPILLIHGEADNNPGTFPIQSERFYHALTGNGATVRYVTLPHESHGYAALESIEHALFEMLSWFDRHVKSAPPPK